MIPTTLNSAGQGRGPSQSGWLRRNRNWLTACLLMLLAWVIYLPSTHYGFIYYDDVRVLGDHPETYGHPTLAADLKAIFVTDFPREEPLLVRDVSWAADSRVFGFGNPFGYHLGNVMFHGVVVALLFAFLLGASGRYGLALAITAAYLLLAIHVEPVIWIMGRKDILSAMFMLLALLAQSRRLAVKTFPPKCAWYGLTLLCFAAGLLSKISVLTFPLVLWLHALLLPYLNGTRPPAERFPWDAALLRETALLVPSMLFSGAIYLWYQRTLAAMGVFDRAYTAHGLRHVWNLLMVNPLGLWVYLRQVFFPVHLAIDYSWPRVLPMYPPWQILAALATIAAAAGAGWWLWRRRKDLFFYYAAFFVLMIPYLNLLYIGIFVADRYLYFSVFCVLAIAFTVGWAVWERAARGARLALIAAGAIWVADNAYQACAYMPAWKNAGSLWQYHLTLPERRADAYCNLAAYYYAQFGDALAAHDQTRAEGELRKMKIVVEAALAEFWPDRRQSPPRDIYFVFFLRSLIEEVTGDSNAALASLLMADQLRPGFDSTNLNLSRLYQKLAAKAPNLREREEYTRAARDRFAVYIKLVYRDRTPPPAVEQEMAGLDAACSALASPAANPARTTSH